MRVIAGEAKGRRLTATRAATMRPTTDRVREALFSALGPDVVEARVLDLYAGSGALGIEALSRGAASAVFVDVAQDAVAAIRANLSLTKLADRATVLRSSAEHFVGTPVSQATQHFDLVFMDPPYAAEPPTGILQALVSRGFLAPEALVILEGSFSEPPEVDGLVPARVRRYGGTALAFLRKGERG